MEVGFYDLFTSYVMELEWYGMVWYVSTWYDVSIIGYCMVCTMMLVLQGMVWYASMVWYDVNMLWYVILVGRVS